MSKQTVTSRLVNCPICNAEVKSRGLHAHLRLLHPNSNIQNELRKRVIAPLGKGERMVFVVSIVTADIIIPEINEIDRKAGSYIIKSSGMNMEAIEMCADFFDSWAETGSFNEAIEIVALENPNLDMYCDSFHGDDSIDGYGDKDGSGENID